MAGACGTCTMCCKLMAVTELSKPKNLLCEHCKPGVGCQIYASRPHGCQVFQCLWLQTHGKGPAFEMAANLRPDKSKVVIHPAPDEGAVVAKVDPGFPMAWSEGPMAYFLAAMSIKLWVLVDNGQRYWVIRDRQIREVRMSKADDAGVEHFIGYVNEAPLGLTG